MIEKTMITHRKIIGIVVCTAVAITILTGCAGAYYGHTKEQWTALTDAQKQTEKAKYTQILKDKETMKHDELIERAKQRVIERGVRGMP